MKCPIKCPCKQYNDLSKELLATQDVLRFIARSYKRDSAKLKSTADWLYEESVKIGAMKVDVR